MNNDKCWGCSFNFTSLSMNISLNFPIFILYFLFGNQKDKPDGIFTHSGAWYKNFKWN